MEKINPWFDFWKSKQNQHLARLREKRETN